MTSTRQQITWKICIVGQSGVGKTTLLHQYLAKKFRSTAETTIGSNFFVKYLKLPEVKPLIALQVWDLAGQERFKWVRNAFYKGAKGIVYVFDLTDKSSFDVILNWKEEVESRVGSIPSILIGNKLDLINPLSRSVTKKESEVLKKQIGASIYMETSAKIGTNVDDAFYELTKLLLKLL